MGQVRVYCTFQVPGYHRWPDALPAAKYLSFEHRHVFHVRVEIQVKHNERDVEFIRFKEIAKVAFESLGRPSIYGDIHFDGQSCETLATNLIQALGDYEVVQVEVSEDGENGAVVSV